MSGGEQLLMLVEKGRLVPRGPRWQWWAMDRDHWVGYPDRRVKVADIDDDWLRNILTYLASWNELRTEVLIDSWWMRSGYFGRGETTALGEVAVAVEMEILDSQTHREWLASFLVPCLMNLEAEARRRGFDVPAIPSYKCRMTKSRVRQESEWARLAEERKAARERDRQALLEMAAAKPVSRGPKRRRKR